MVSSLRSQPPTTNDASEELKPVPFVTTQDGTEIFSKDWASGQPVVFHYGWPLSSDDWDAAGRRRRRMATTWTRIGPCGQGSAHRCRSCR